MAEPPEDLSPELEEEGGGPVKPFLEHLEDLRWMLIKSVSAVGLAMIVCLIAGDRLMAFIKRPLDRSASLNPGTNQVLAVRFGTNWIGRFHPGTNQVGTFLLGSNRVSGVEIVPITVNGQTILALQPTTALPPDDVSGNKVSLLSLGPAGAFALSFKLAVYGGLVIASPFVIFFIAQFVLPALKINEKKYILRGFGIGVFLFLTGVAFCYALLMPVALRAAVTWANWLGLEANQWNAEEYASFVCKFMLGMGLGFEMPVIILIFVKLGVINYRQLAAFRRYMIVINLILGAVLTTPEVLTQILMAIPLQMLYEITVWIAWWWERRERKRQEALGIEPLD